ncbi:MAG: hypothetical protein Q8908_09040 [Bacteroidota bacterium]|nr:hypothetical protein [Bacteroidota bacterium]
MRFIAKIKFPNEPGNDRIKDPEFGIKMKQILEEVKAEAAYFTTIDGCRGVYLVVNLTDNNQLPLVAEPFFLWLNATVEYFPVMTPQDLNSATAYIDAASRKWGN